MEWRPKYHRLLGGEAFGRLTVHFKPGDTAHAVEQLNWMRAQFFANGPDDRPAARKASGRASAASKWADRIRYLATRSAAPLSAVARARQE
ncbi:hypothetical protein ACFYO2_47740 [Streptomyces sp. NPDC006602]|uniref:hypothetical protein n=1 Tax=Streptomyces sp. NPDC006602 TaxID=3364751 RepID=UPI0036CB08A8